MKLEERVCSLDLAKKLKGLGVKQESLFYWANMQNGVKLVIKCKENSYQVLGDFCGVMITKSSIICSAFTVAELGEMLPKGFRSGKMEHGLFKIYNKNPMYQPKTGELRDSTEANARAKMLIYLKEQENENND